MVELARKLLRIKARRSILFAAFAVRTCYVIGRKTDAQALPCICPKHWLRFASQKPIQHYPRAIDRGAYIAMFVSRRDAENAGSRPTGCCC